MTLEDLLLLLPEEQELEHRVVRDQDVRWPILDLLPEVALLVGRPGRARQEALLLQARPLVVGCVPGVPAEGDARPRELHAQALELIVRQRVHRVQDHRAHAGRLPVAQAVVDDRDEERLGLARAGVRGHDRVLRPSPERREPPDGADLVVVEVLEAPPACEDAFAENALGDELGQRRALLEGPRQRHERVLPEEVLLLDQPLEARPQLRPADRKTRLHVAPVGVLDVLGGEEGLHGWSTWLARRRGSRECRRARDASARASARRRRARRSRARPPAQPAPPRDARDP